VFRLVYLPGRGLIGSIIALLGLVLRVSDHTAFSRSSAMLAVSWLNVSAEGAAEPIDLTIPQSLCKRLFA
jgi:hypothetical protein